MVQIGMVIAVSGATVDAYELGTSELIDSGQAGLRCRGKVNRVDIGAKVMTRDASGCFDFQHKLGRYAL